MAINISAWSIRHPLPPLVMAAAIVALGFISFNKLPVTRMPNVDVPVVSVTVTQFGAAPAELESRVTKAVEDAVSGVQAGADGGFALVIGVARENNHAALWGAGADLVVSDLAETNLAAINTAIRAKREKA